MEYIGAADYHFWNGVYHAYNSEGLIGADFLAPTFHMDNDVTRDCLTAFNWGFCLGLELTEDEYIELTTIPEEKKETFISATKKVVDKMTKDMIKSLNEPDFETLIKIVGNC